jgi:hypothetical protein
MKFFLMAIFCLLSLGLQAAQFQHKISIAPVPVTETGTKEYSAEVIITKQQDEQTQPVVIFTRKFTCVEGEFGEVSEYTPSGGLIDVRVFIPENHENKAQVSIFFTEDDKVVVLKENETVPIKQLRVIRHWADRRQQLLNEAQE